MKCFRSVFLNMKISECLFFLQYTNAFFIKHLTMSATLKLLRVLSTSKRILIMGRVI